MSTSDSLDQRYLEFAARTAEVFLRFPQMEPLRYYIFRNLLIAPRPMGLQEAAKRWVRPFVRRQCTAGPLQKGGGVLVWIEGERSIIRDTVMPVAEELRRRGVPVRFVSLSGPESLPAGTVTCRYPAVHRVPLWAAEAWQALSQAEPQMATRAAARAFQYACADNDGLLSEVSRILDAMDPRIVVTASTQLMGGSALVVAARQRRTPSVLLQHGLLQPLYVPVVADVMCTWGPSSSDTLTQLGVDPRKLIALGSPRHDAMTPSRNGTARRALLRCLSLEDKPTVVFFSNGNDVQRNGSAPQACAEWMEAIAREYRTRLNVIVRLHPNEDASLYRRCSHLVVTKHQPEFAALLDGCDGVVSLCSTALYEALLYHKPIWQLAAPGWPDLADNWKRGLARRVASLDELRKQVERWLDTKGPDRHVGEPVEAVFKNHGLAAHAVAHFISSQLHTSSVAESYDLSHQPVVTGPGGA
jgi:hypothetical protein